MQRPQVTQLCGLRTVRVGFLQAVEASLVVPFPLHQSGAISSLAYGFAVGRFVVSHRNKLWDSFIFPLRWYFASETKQAGLRGQAELSAPIH